MARRLAVATIFLWAAVASARPFTGTFVADGRPRWMQFLSLTQTQENVTGFLVIAQPDDRGGTTSDTISLDGVADGDSLTLHTKTFLNLGEATMTGRLNGSVLTLSFPLASGAMESNRFTRSNQERFNSALRAWQLDLKAAHEKRRAAEEVAAARERKADAARRSAQTLRDTATGLSTSGQALHVAASFTSQLAACDSALKAMQQTADRIEKELHRLTPCARLRDEVSYLGDQLSYLRDARSYLEDHARDVSDAARTLQEQRSELTTNVESFDLAVDADPTGSIAADRRREIIYASKALLKMTADEFENARRATSDARSAGDAAVAKGVALNDELKQRIAHRCPLQ